MADNNTTQEEKKEPAKDTAMENIWALSCYVPIFNIVTCTLTSIKMVNSKLCRFHARQGLVMFALMFLTMFVPLISTSLSFLVWILLFGLHGAAMYFSYQKKDIRFPVLAQLAEKIPEYFIFKTLTGKNPERDEDSTLQQKTEAPAQEQPVQTAPTQPEQPKVQEQTSVATPTEAPVQPEKPQEVAPAQPQAVQAVPQQPIPTEQPAVPTLPPTPEQPKSDENGGGSVQWTSRNH